MGIIDPDYQPPKRKKKKCADSKRDWWRCNFRNYWVHQLAMGYQAGIYEYHLTVFGEQDTTVDTGHDVIIGNKDTNVDTADDKTTGHIDSKTKLP